MSKLTHQEAFLENSYNSVHDAIQGKRFLEADSHIRLVRAMGYEKEANDFTVTLEKAKNEAKEDEKDKMDDMANDLIP